MLSSLAVLILELGAAGSSEGHFIPCPCLPTASTKQHLHIACLGLKLLCQKLHSPCAGPSLLQLCFSAGALWDSEGSREEWG